MAWKQADKPVPLPLQALDHATGYLMAASAIRALSERLASGRGGSAALVIGAHGEVVGGCGASAGAGGVAAEPSDQGLVVERTAWGPGPSVAGTTEHQRHIAVGICQRGNWGHTDLSGDLETAIGASPSHIRPHFKGTTRSSVGRGLTPMNQLTATLHPMPLSTAKTPLYNPYAATPAPAIHS